MRRARESPGSTRSPPPVGNRSCLAGGILTLEFAQRESIRGDRMIKRRRLLAWSGAVVFGVALLQAPQATAASMGVTVKPPLPLSAYQGLSCDVSHPRLKRTALSNGAGPEARVAAACWRLEWLSRSGVATPPISVHASPQFPSWLIKRIEGAAAAGHRLFGRFADVSSYEIIASDDPD